MAPNESTSRRGLLLALGAAALGVGGYAMGAGGTGADGRLGGLSNPLESTPTGQGRFSLSNGGYLAAEWVGGTTLEITFDDNPPMHRWYLIGPAPERRLIESGSPPRNGGTRRVDLELPIQAGEYRLTGAEVDLQPEQIGASSEQTGTASFRVTDDIRLMGVEPLGDGSGRAELTVRNTGSCPLEVAGARFSPAVPGTGTRKYAFFEDAATLLLPNESHTGVTTSYPFTVPNTDRVEVPDEYLVGVWAHDEPWAFRVRGDDIDALADIPSSLSP